METLELLLRTVWLRPYVFVFMATFLCMAVPVWGWRRTLLYAAIGYTVAWACEYSSIHNGFPFGPYEYVSEPTIDKELWVAGVPFMDSLSFVFLNFAGLQMARLALEPIRRGPRGVWDLRWADPERLPDWKVWILGALLTMGLDWVIDPVALQGHRWFLGDIYNYVHGGEYFGVPWTNFGGWLFVALVVIGIFLLVDRRLLRGRSQGAAVRRGWGEWRSYPADALVGAGLFVGVLAFNLGVTFAIGETVMGLVGCLWAAAMAEPVVLRVMAALRPAAATVSQAVATDVEPSQEPV